MQLKAGDRLRSPNSLCELLVVRGPESEGDLLCAGTPMTTDAVGATADEGESGEMLEVGKRYSVEDEGLEVLCVKPGRGPLEFNGSTLELKATKPLPASD